MLVLIGFVIPPLVTHAPTPTHLHRLCHSKKPLLVLEDKTDKSNLWVLTKNCMLFFFPAFAVIYYPFAVQYIICALTLISPPMKWKIEELSNARGPWTLMKRYKPLQWRSISNVSSRVSWAVVAKSGETYQEMQLKRQCIKSVRSTK